ncbi:MAG: hypothetical protein ACRDKW_07630 [Actinomycetota bacterium]
MAENGDLPTIPLFVVDGDDVIVFPDVESAASALDPVGVAGGACLGYDATGRRLGLTAAGPTVTIGPAEPVPSRAEELAAALRAFLLAAGETAPSDPRCGLPCLVELSRRHMVRPTAWWPRLMSCFNPVHHPLKLRRAEALAGALFISVGLPIAGLREILANPGWFGVTRALIHAGIPLLLLAALVGVTMPDLGLPRRQSLLLFLPFLSLPGAVRVGWRVAALPDRYWARRW